MMLLPRLLLIADQHRERPGALEIAVAAGAAFVQIRDKDLDDAAVEQRLRIIRDAPKAPGPSAEHSSASPSATRHLISINGRPALARNHGVGLHLPAAHEVVTREDIPLLGRSAHDEEEVHRALTEGVDYLIVGTVFPSASKPGRAPLGLNGLARLSALASPWPVFAIGGITAQRVSSVLATGAHGVAVCGAILDADDPAAATAHFLAELPA